MNGQGQGAPSGKHEVACSGPPVLFFHGRFSSAQLWTGVERRLAEHYATACCDLQVNRPGAGIQGAEGVLACLDNLGLTVAHLVAHGSTWSPVTQLAATCPDRVLSLTLVDPIVPRSELSPAIQENWHLEMLLQWLSASQDSAIRRPENVAFLRGVVAQQTHARMASEATAPGALATESELTLTRLCCPVLALVGEQAPAESKALVASYLGKVRHARILPVPRAARYSPVEAPEAVARLMQDFLTDAESHR